MSFKICLSLYLQAIIVFQCVFEYNCLDSPTLSLERPGRNLCSEEPEVNCSNQFTSELDARCLMKHFNQSSTECMDTSFSGDINRSESEKYGIINLIPFTWYEGFPYSALNITFTNIQWKSLKIRFVKVGSSIAQNCREFVVSGDVNTSSLSYDCLWGGGAIAEQDYKFQYVLTTKDDKKYLHTHLLRIPKDRDSKTIAPEDYNMFILMDQTEFPDISLKVQVPPVKFNVTRVSVTLYYKEDKNSNVDMLESRSLDLTTKEEGEFIRVGPFDTDSSPGYYYFNVSFSSDYCKNRCVESSTPLLQITGLKHGAQVKTAVVLISILALGLVIFLTWKNKYKKIPEGPEKPPSILFVYESNYPSHIENIYKFKEFLEDSCYMVVKLDLMDIPKTESMDPWKWYYNAFKDVEYVFLFASPDDPTEKGLHEDNVYHNLHIYAYKLLALYLLHNHKFSVASIKLPGCSWKVLPPEAQIIDKRFALPLQLKELFRFLNVPLLNDGGSKLITALQRSRSPPQFSVSRPADPLQFPSFEEDDVARKPIVIGGGELKLDGLPNEEEEEEYYNDNEENTLKMEQSFIGLKF